MDQEVLDARAKLAARFGKTQVGGKGKSSVPTSFYGSNAFLIGVWLNITYINRVVVIFL
jgi:hypothetical protein